MKILAWLLPVLLLSCKGDPEIILNNTELLTESDWIVESGTVDPPQNGSNDYFDLVGECARDDVYMFNRNFSLVIDEDTVLCDTTQTANGAWSFNTEETQLLLNRNDLPVPLLFNIVVINEEMMILDLDTLVIEAVGFSLNLKFVH
ncbi:MAG TPA: hypothetical protein DDX92_08235 [Flavobacteriales bacterium]|jgi:hypothetical protein|nr:hypothetical protein [Flavobacteriales bacterium]